MNKILLVSSILAFAAIGALVFVLSNLDNLVKEAIETYGSEATGTSVTVYDVKIALKSGESRINSLRVSNPRRFSDLNMFELGLINMKIDPATLNQNPIVIDEIIISAPSVVYEINKSGVSNIDVLKKNLAQSANSAANNGGGDELKIIIRKLIIEESTAKVRIAALGDAQQTVTFPKIQLADVGEKNGGATAAEVAQVLFSKLLGNVNSSVAGLGVDKYLGKSADMFKNDALNKAGQAGSDAGAAVSDAAKKAGGAFKGLLGN